LIPKTEAYATEFRNITNSVVTSANHFYLEWLRTEGLCQGPLATEIVLPDSYREDNTGINL